MYILWINVYTVGLQFMRPNMSLVPKFTPHAVHTSVCNITDEDEVWLQAMMQG
jgi:hypothetical protein